MTAPKAKPIRVLVVDDSFLMREFVSRGIGIVEDIEVIARCADSVEARSAIRRLDPDVITLDVEMPGMNGIEFLKKIMMLRPTPVVMVSSFTSKGGEISLEALENGAVDVVEKPTNSKGVEKFVERLISVIRSCKNIDFERGSNSCNAQLVITQSRLKTTICGSGARLIALGSSTGGVFALQTILQGIPVDAPPIVIAQHMPAPFVHRFAGRLASSLSRQVYVAEPDQLLLPGKIYFSPGDSHLEVTTREEQLFCRLLKTGLVSGHTPSVDVLFGSVANAVGPGAVGVILTGMGKDGSIGMRSMKDSGSLCLGQSERSCVVYGMKWSGKFGQRAKMYPTRTNGYENDEETELFRQV